MVILMTWGCICFDLDNTLLDYENAFKKGMIHTFHHFFEGEWSLHKKMESFEWFPVFKKLCNELWADVEAKKYTKQEYKEKRFTKSLQYFGLDAVPEMAISFQKYFYSIIHQFVEPMENVDLLLNYLAERHLSLGIITNGNTVLQLKKIKAIGFDKWFSESNVFVSQEFGISKPDSKLFQIASQELNHTSQPSLYIGDSWELDVVGSVNAGWQAIYFNSRNEEPTTTHRPIGICSTMDEVRVILDG